MRGVQPEVAAHLKEGAGHSPTPDEGSIARRGSPTRHTLSARYNAAQRRLRMAAMCADEMTVREIAKVEGVSHTYVADEIKALIDDLHTQALQTLQMKVAREIAVINMVQLEATIAFYESKEGKITNMKRRKKEVRSAFVNTNKRARFNVVKTGEALGMSPLEVQQNTRGRLASLFADTSSTDPPVPEIPQEAPTEQGQMVVQLPVESEEDYERVELSAGQREWLSIILECVDKRCRLQNLYKVEGEEGYDQLVTMTSEQRASRLRALAQDIRAAMVIAGRGNELPPARQDFVTPAQQQTQVIDVVAAPVAPSGGDNKNGGPQ